MLSKTNKKGLQSKNLAGNSGLPRIQKDFVSLPP